MPARRRARSGPRSSKSRPGVETGTAIGEIKPRYKSDISFRVGGKVLSRHVDVGAIVSKGALVAQLDSTSAKTVIGIAVSDVAAATAGAR